MSTPLQTISNPPAIEKNESMSCTLKKRASLLIPGGSHTYAKGDDQYPEEAPSFIVRGKGCHVWDVDGNEYIEYGMGSRSVTLGHAFDSVVKAAYRQMQLGINFTRPAKIEIDAAEAFLCVIQNADMVKFAKNGSDVTTAAVKLARAYTGKEYIAICGDHPFFSTDDWFIGTTETNAGIPEAVVRLTLKFHYNDLGSLETLFDEHGGNIACVVMEAESVVPPRPEYLQSVKNLCEDHGAVLIFDEMITGFRWHLGGAQRFYAVVPHLSTFGKAMGNGYAISALTGERRIMRLGGLDHDQERVFLLSSTHGAEGHALAAMIETLRIYREFGVVEWLWRQGELLKTYLIQSIQENSLEGYFEVLGQPCNLIYSTRDQNRERSQAFRTLFMQEMICRGVIAPSFVVSYSHGDSDIKRTADAAHEAFTVYRKAINEGVEKYLKCRPVKPVNRRYN